MTPDDPLIALQRLRDVVEFVERRLVAEKSGTRRQAELHIAWHQLLNAYSLITSGRVSPDDLQWGSEQANEILTARTLAETGR